MLENILVGLDGSPLAESIVRFSSACWPVRSALA
jgi:hypothetical protein